MLRALGVLALTVGTLHAGACAQSARFGDVTVHEGASRRALDPLKTAQAGVASVGVVETDVGRGLAFVVDASGYLLTNRHVVEDADFIERVVFPALDPPRRYSGVRVVYIDPERDLALLKVETDAPLPRLRLASARQAPLGDYLEIADRVLLLAAKKPGGAAVDGRELESGFVAHLGRVRDLEVYNDAVGRGPYFGFTSAVERGQSGGPVLDRYGRAVGIVTWTWKNRAGGYAIPISAAAEMLAERPTLETESQQLARARGRAERFVAALNERRSERARVMLSPTHARAIRTDTLRAMGEHVEGDGQEAVQQFVGALESLIGDVPEIKDDDQRFEAVLELVLRTGSESFRESLGVGDELPGDQVVSFFWEFAHAYVSARHFGELSVGDAVDAALRRLQSLDAARTFAFADFSRRLADARVTIDRVELIPGVYAPTAVVTLRAEGGRGRSRARPLETPDGEDARFEDVEHVLQMRMEWGDWYMAELQTRARG
ncbi:MAG: trypsin-like peptidase domain-containing protein [Myxococcales bacterium]|nr:trypsin-like peptidase domain-containing protein [Myxococcales bacterium]MCB9755262.1 trypsin-like peptidase domain-containing protein [Myxococcales bacterium]